MKAINPATDGRYAAVRTPRELANALENMAAFIRANRESGALARYMARRALWLEEAAFVIRRRLPPGEGGIEHGEEIAPGRPML